MFQVTADQLIGVFGSATFNRAKGYVQQGMVQEYTVNARGDRIQAQVRGSGRNSYQQTIRLYQDERGEWSIFGQCSCPVGFNCKHVLAVMMLYSEAVIDQIDDPGVNMELHDWLRRVEAFRAEPDQGERGAIKPGSRQLAYLLGASQEGNGAHDFVDMVSIVRQRNDSWKVDGEYHHQQGLCPDFLTREDLYILSLLDYDRGRNRRARGFSLNGPNGGEALRQMLASGRCFWQQFGKHRLRLGEPRAADIVWKLDAQGRQKPGIEQFGKEQVIHTRPLMYLDLQANCCGEISMDKDPRLVSLLLQGPAIEPEAMTQLREDLPAPLRALPPPKELVRETLTDLVPVPCLRLVSEPVVAGHRGRRFGRDVLLLSLRYQNWLLGPSPHEEWISFSDGDSFIRLRRDSDAEQRVFALLEEIGFMLKTPVASGLNEAAEWTLLLSEQWLEFMQFGLPHLRQLGWEVEVEDDFRFLLREAEGWYVDLQEHGSDWFELGMGVELDGEKFDLLPFLVDFLQTEKDALRPETLEQLPDDFNLLVQFGPGKLLQLPLERVRTITETLVELYDEDAVDDHGKLRLPRLRSNLLADLDSDGDIRWQGGEQLRAYGERLRSFTGIDAVDVPKGLHAELRGYQRQGLNWLQFLRQYDLSGVLADDMGLGKTIQTLAHLLLEKEQGRADRPSLIVAPTSLMTNWQREAERFCPDLKVLLVHGQGRQRLFDGIGDADLVLTTYPLIVRDLEQLQKHAYHLLVLDEAQAIKNTKTKASQALRRLQARHRLCLTGTPMENHLGELWALFQFLMPGYLGDARQFRRLFRNPIEKEGDRQRAEQIRKRIAPFVLRRDKAEVASELPAKTEILTEVELTQAQKDLYETVRNAMHEKVRAEIEAKGLARSHIMVLDALLKLRQICCHPQLLSLQAARSVTESAKLDLLLGMVAEMLEEGRRILIFSQFAKMLQLIAKGLDGIGVDYVKLTGQTRDRARQVDAFQSGIAPVFLISLKAGGTGLNLTAADTVIHYDPWWNPAAERQATDRAYRIGQDKPVFVYKLITRGTVEERIAEMQSRKQELADALFSDRKSQQSALSAGDLDVLFQPLEDDS